LGQPCNFYAPRPGELIEDLPLRTAVVDDFVASVTAVPAAIRAASTYPIRIVVTNGGARLRSVTAGRAVPLTVEAVGISDPFGASSRER
jgi:hypothetical protein